MADQSDSDGSTSRHSTDHEDLKPTQLASDDVSSRLETDVSGLGSARLDMSTDHDNDGYPCHILRLPTEMMEWVAFYLPAVDIAALRITCRDINDRVIREFSTKAFSDMTFLLSWPRSLQIMEDVSNHIHFSKSIKKLRFCFLEIHGSKEDEKARRRGQQPASGLASGESRDARMQHRDSRRIYEGLIAEQKAFRGLKDPGVLVRSLSNICFVGHASNDGIAIELYDKLPPNVHRPCGEKALERILGYEGVLAPARQNWPYRGHPTRSFAQALKSLPHPLVHLKVADANAPIVLSDFTELSNVGCFQQLRSLDLSTGHSPPELRLSDYEAFRRALVGLSKLTHLGLQVGYGYRIGLQRMLVQCLEEIHMPNLRSVELAVPGLTLEMLILFIKKHMSTLRQITTYSSLYRHQTYHSAELIADYIKATVGNDSVEVNVPYTRS